MHSWVALYRLQRASIGPFPRTVDATPLHPLYSRRHTVPLSLIRSSGWSPPSRLPCLELRRVSLHIHPLEISASPQLLSLNQILHILHPKLLSSQHFFFSLS